MTVTVGLVLGAGGTVGLAYHAGVLRALDRVAGFTPDRAELVVGTSAGSVIAAYVRSGWSTEQLWDIVVSSEHVPPAPQSEAELTGLPRLFVTAARTPMDAVRRGAGSAFVMSRSVLRLPLPALPAPLRRAFPGGMFSMLEGQRRFESELPEMWPAKDTWLCTVDIVSGRRIVLGRPRPPHMSLARAVMASCAIPGAYPPVRYGRRELIDGGAHSSTNLDVASRYGCDLIVAIVPMGYDQTDPPGCVGRVTRRLANGSLASEVARVSRRGTRVVTVSPSAAEARLHGVNLMRSHGLLAVAEAAYESTARRLTEERATESGLFAALAPVGQGWGSSPATTL